MSTIELSSRKLGQNASDRLKASNEKETFQKQEKNKGKESEVIGSGLLSLQSALGNRAVLGMLNQNGKLEEDSGSPIPESIKGKMEASFGTDFSDVRTHESYKAGDMGARAMARGTDIFFAPGQLTPNTKEGQSLLGHELSHVVQQREGRVGTPQANVFPLVDADGLENEADREGERASHGEAAKSTRAEGEHVSASSAGTMTGAESAPVQASFFSSLAGVAKKGFSAAKKFATSKEGKQLIGGALSFGGQALAGSNYGQGNKGSLLASGMNVAGGMIGDKEEDSDSEETSGESAGSEKAEEEKVLEEEKEDK